MESSAEKFDLLEQRVVSLEEKVFGDKKDESIKVIDALIGLHNKLQSLVTGREKITSVYSKLDEIQKYLDPEFADSLALSDGAKMHLIFAAEDKIREAVDSLQTIQDLEQYMHSEHIKATPTFLPRLQKINKAELELADSVSAFNEETKRLADEYNYLIECLSEKFVLWDSMLTELEKEGKDSNRALRS